MSPTPEHRRLPDGAALLAWCQEWAASETPRGVPCAAITARFNAAALLLVAYTNALVAGRMASEHVTLLW